MHDISSIAQNTDRAGSGAKIKGNLFNFLKVPYYKEYAMVKDQGESGLGYTDPLQWTRQEKYIWFFTLLAGTAACYSARTTMPLVAPTISEDMKWSKTEVSWYFLSNIYFMTMLNHYIIYHSNVNFAYLIQHFTHFRWAQSYHHFFGVIP